MHIWIVHIFKLSDCLAVTEESAINHGSFDIPTPPLPGLRLQLAA